MQMKDKVKIKSVLKNIFSGYSFRTKIENDPRGDLAVIQMKDLRDNYSTIGSGLTQIDASDISSKYILHKGDILFISKGSNNFAVLYDLDIPKAIASSAFFILRPETSKVSPAYLAWYINQKPVQQYIKDNRAGTYIPNINKSTITGIEIELPAKNVQEKIVKIDFLRKKENLLMNQLIVKREQFVSDRLMSLLNN